MTVSKELQVKVDSIIKKLPESKAVFQEVYEYFEEVNRKTPNTLKCQITLDKVDMTKLPKDMFKLQMSKKRKLLYTAGNAQQRMFTVDDSFSESATQWNVLQEIKTMHTGKLYLCDSGIVLYHAKKSFAVETANIKDIKIEENNAHNCTISINGKMVEYFPLDLIEDMQDYASQIGKPLQMPNMQKKKGIVDKLMEDADNAEEDDTEDDTEDEFEAGAGNDSD